MGMFDLDENFYQNPQRMSMMRAAIGGLSQGDANSRMLAGMFGGITEGGAQALQYKRQQQLDQAQQQMQQLKMRAMQGDMEAEQQARAIEAQIQAEIRKGGQGAPQAPQAPPQLSSTPQMSTPGMPLPSGPARPQDPRRAFISEQQRIAGIRQQFGDTKGAMGIYEGIDKIQPKVKAFEKVRVGDSVMYAPYFEDGSAGEPVPLEVARELEARNLDDRTAMLDKITGREVSSFKHGVSANTLSNNAVQIRGQNMNDSRQREMAALTRQGQQNNRELMAQEKQLRIDALTDKKEDRALSRLNGSASIAAQIGVIDKALNHPGRGTSTGLSGTLDPRNYVPGTDASDFRAVADQIGGGAFLQAFESLKGAGQITEVEGKKATDAIARLSRAQSDSEYVTALTDLKEVMSEGLKRRNQAYGIASPASPGGPAPAGGGWSIKRKGE